MDTPGTADVKAGHRRMWALGDYPAIATEVIGGLGPRLVAACGIGPGQRVLDVAAGSGNVAIPAAETGARVVASDLTPELLDAGRRAATARGVELEWTEADAEALPFPDAAFDVVVSSVGAMFAPDHRATASELARVTKPGGTIGLISWTPEGFVGDMFATMGRHVPAPPGTESPLRWGTEDHVRDLLGDAVASLELTRETLTVDHFSEPAAYLEYYKARFGPTIAGYATLAGDGERSAALDRDLIDLFARWIRSEPGRPAVMEWEYLLAVARRAG